MSEPRRILLLGEAPGPRARRGEPPLGGKAGRRLARLAGKSEDELRALVATRNLLPRFPGRAGKGARFPLPEARRRAAALRTRAPVLLLAGRRVAAAFGLRLPYLTWATQGRQRVAVLPHPSGVNRWWNDPRHVAAARRFLRRALRTPPA